MAWDGRSIVALPPAFPTTLSTALPTALPTATANSRVQVHRLLTFDTRGLFSLDSMAMGISVHCAMGMATREQLTLRSPPPPCHLTTQSYRDRNASIMWIYARCCGPCIIREQRGALVERVPMAGKPNSLLRLVCRVGGHSKLMGAQTLILTFDTRGLFSLDSMGISAHGAMSMSHVHSRC